MPELATWGSGDQPVDIRISTGDGAPPSPTGRRISPRLTIEPDGAARLEIEDIATFHVREGRKVQVSDLRVGVEDAALRLYLLGTVLVILCHQRGLLPLHGSAVRWDKDGAVAFLGRSGAGKSTLAATLRQAGRMALADDVCPLDLTNGRPLLLPAFPRLKLWREALPIAGLAQDAADLVDAASGKHHFRFVGAGAYDPTPAPLKAIYILETGAAGAPARVEEIGSPPDRFAALQGHVPRRRYADAAKLTRSLFEQLVHVAAVTPVRRLVRCAEPERIAETVAVLNASLAGHDALA